MGNPLHLAEISQRQRKNRDKMTTLGEACIFLDFRQPGDLKWGTPYLWQKYAKGKERIEIK